ncbi:MAG: hypothetical protein ACREXQ_07755, partial [Polaromonas sp.]
KCPEVRVTKAALVAGAIQLRLRVAFEPIKLPTRVLQNCIHKYSIVCIQLVESVETLGSTQTTPGFREDQL